MRNAAITVIICCLVLGAGYIYNRYFAPEPSLERLLPRLVASFERAVLVTSHESAKVAFYMTQDGRLGLAISSTGHPADIQAYSPIKLPNQGGAFTQTEMLEGTDDYLVFGMIGNPAIARVYLNDAACESAEVEDTRFWYCFTDTQGGLHIDGMDASGIVKYRSTLRDSRPAPIPAPDVAIPDDTVPNAVPEA